MISQKEWRRAGLFLIGLSVVMAIVGVRWNYLREDPVLFLIYWLVCFVCLLGALYTALLDWRYIRAEYAVEKRDIFQKTIQDFVQKHADEDSSKENSKKVSD